MRILFTPAGDTDPVRDYHDGAILHILRHYPADKVILFLTKDMEEKEDEMHCYTRGIASVAPDVPVEILRSGITEPQKYEKLTAMQDAFASAYDAHPEAEWLLNVSSGTPQIKTVMALLALDYPRTKAFRCQAQKENRTAKISPARRLMSSSKCSTAMKTPSPVRWAAAKSRRSFS